MEAIQYTASDKKLQFLFLDIPKISGPKDVLIKVAFSGVCGTDIHIIQVIIAIYMYVFKRYN